MKASTAPSGATKPRKQTYCTPRWLVDRLKRDEGIILDVCGSPTRPTDLAHHIFLPEFRHRAPVRGLLNQWIDDTPRAVLGNGLRLPWNWHGAGAAFYNPTYRNQGEWVARAVYNLRAHDAPSTGLVQVATSTTWWVEIAALYCQIDFFDCRIPFEDELTGETVDGVDFEVALVHARRGFAGAGTWRYRSGKTGRLLEIPRGAFHPRLPGL